MSQKPFVPPPSDADHVEGVSNELLEIVVAQRGMMWLLAAKFGTDFTFSVAKEFTTDLLLIAYLSVCVLVALAMGYYVFRLSNAIYGVGPAVVCAVISLVPCLGLLAVLILNGNAIDQLRKAGVRVGFMGATKSQLAEMQS